MGRSMMRGAAPVLLAGLMLVASGCGRGGGKSESAADAAPETNNLVKGKTVSKVSQLIGTWFSESDIELVGVEFLDGGKTMLTYGTRSQEVVTMDYSLLDDGRLSIVGPGGLTMLLNTKISGDRLELNEVGASPDEAKQYRRLAKGETIVAALQAKAERQRKKAEELAERNRQQAEALVQAAAKLLSSGKATVKPVDAQMLTTPHIALEVGSIENNQINGFAYYDIPGRKHALTGSVVADSGQGKAIVNLQFGAQVDPPDPAIRSAGAMSFVVTGDSKNLAANTTVRFGSGQPVEMHLAPDEALHARLVEALAIELRVREKVRAPFKNLLKDRVELAGTFHNSGYRRDDPLRVVLQTGDKANDYTGEMWSINGNVYIPAKNTKANILVSGGFPRLSLTGQFSFTQISEYLFDSIDEQAGTLTGKWHIGNVNAWHPVELRVVRAWSADEWKTEAAAQETLLREKLTPDAPLRGMIVSGASGRMLNVPVALAIQSASDGSVAGKASFPSVIATVDVQGRIQDTPLGPKLQLQFGDGEGTQDMGIPLLQWMQGGAIDLSVLSDDESVVFMGYARNQRGAMLPAQLSVIDSEGPADLRRRVEKTLTDGVTFKLLEPAAARDQFAHVELHLDPSTGRVTGQFDDGGRVLNAAPPATLVGELGEENGWTTLSFRVIPPEGKRDPQVSCRLHFVEVDGKLRMLGVQTWVDRRHYLLEFIEQDG